MMVNTFTETNVMLHTTDKKHVSKPYANDTRNRKHADKVVWLLSLPMSCHVSGLIHIDDKDVNILHFVKKSFTSKNHISFLL